MMTQEPVFRSASQEKPGNQLTGRKRSENGPVNETATNDTGERRVWEKWPKLAKTGKSIFESTNNQVFEVGSGTWNGALYWIFEKYWVCQMCMCKKFRISQGYRNKMLCTRNAANYIELHKKSCSTDGLILIYKVHFSYVDSILIMLIAWVRGTVRYD